MKKNRRIYKGTRNKKNIQDGIKIFFHSEWEEEDEDRDMYLRDSSVAQKDHFEMAFIREHRIFNIGDGFVSEIGWGSVQEDWSVKRQQGQVDWRLNCLRA